jgi:hypothetical protein
MKKNCDADFTGGHAFTVIGEHAAAMELVGYGRAWNGDRTDV